MPSEIIVTCSLAWYFPEPGFAMSLALFRYGATVGQTLQAVWALVSLMTFVQSSSSQNCQLLQMTCIRESCGGVSLKGIKLNPCNSLGGCLWWEMDLKRPAHVSQNKDSKCCCGLWNMPAMTSSVFILMYHKSIRESHFAVTQAIPIQQRT